MAQIPKEQVVKLRKAIHDHDFLHRILRQIENLLRVVFHAHELEWSFIRAAAEEILIADIVTRHHGNIDAVYYSLRKVEQSGRSWEQSIRVYAAYCHNYFTTPLGVVIRRDYFGEEAHFVSPAAGKYSALYREGAKTGTGPTPPVEAVPQAGRST